MKTVLPEAITTVEEAKAFLTALSNNGEEFHPEDPAEDCISHLATPEECQQVNKLMEDIYNLPENGGRHDNSIGFCPCGFLLAVKDYYDDPRLLSGDDNADKDDDYPGIK